jgi:hypothetical protein
MTQNRVIQSISVILWQFTNHSSRAGRLAGLVFPRLRAPKLETVSRARGPPRQVKLVVLVVLVVLV